MTPSLIAVERATDMGAGHAKDLIFSGRSVDAYEAQRMGLVNAIVPRDEVLVNAIELAGRFAAGPIVALAAAKAAIDGGLNIGLEEGLKLERALFASLFATSDKEIGMQSFLDSGPGKAAFIGT